ncbi:hypothetical protein N7G274_006202 [Stereocaulon virgatum]|uniref:Uncharacterized protein n=1 Tax=Stereocaulon virgatum TaxID=373712 RepID=A0ABR4A5S1_9LECA
MVQPSARFTSRLSNSPSFSPSHQLLTNKPFDAALLNLLGPFQPPRSRIRPHAGHAPATIIPALQLSNCELKSSNKPFPFESGHSKNGSESRSAYDTGGIMRKTLHPA